jgi:hypothetical protein
VAPAIGGPAKLRGSTGTTAIIERRYSSAVDATAPAADLAALIEEAESGIAKAEKEGTVEQTLSLDPQAARQAIADATFAANRLRTLLSKLQTRYRQVRDQEEATAWLAECDVVKRERDALAEELRKVYPNAIAQIMDVFVRITNNNEAMSALHQARPAGVQKHLLSAELDARGLDGFSRDTPSLLTSVQLIDWDSGRQIWPLPRPSMASAFAAAVPVYDRRCTADWAKDNEQHAAAQRAEGQRHADYLARTSKEQEDPQNAEARESFMEQQQRLSVNRPIKS